MLGPEMEPTTIVLGPFYHLTAFINLLSLQHWSLKKEIIVSWLNSFIFIEGIKTQKVKLRTCTNTRTHSSWLIRNAILVPAECALTFSRNKQHHPEMESFQMCFSPELKILASLCLPDGPPVSPHKSKDRVWSKWPGWMMDQECVLQQVSRAINQYTSVWLAG